MTFLKYCILCVAVVSFFACNKLKDLNQQPDLTPLTQGFKATAAIGYCASIAQSAFNGDPLPANMQFSSQSKSGFTGAGIITVTVDANNPLPFNHNTGSIIIGGLWSGNSGVISILFANIDLLSAQVKFYGLYTVPVFIDASGKTVVVFAQQDIVVGQGQDTLINLNLTKAQFDVVQTDPVYSAVSNDPFVAVTQNVWQISLDQHSTPSNFYDDLLSVTGGGQIVSATSIVTI